MSGSGVTGPNHVPDATGDSDIDVIVVGSGPCGAIAADRLVDRGLRVTMVDAGATAPRGVIVRLADRTVFKWVADGHMSTDRHVAVRDRPSEWFSSLALGGLSNYWTSAVPRFAAEDFTEGAVIDERFRWPIGYSDLEPFYDVAERALSVSGGVALANVPSNRVAHHVSLPDDWELFARRAEAHGHHVAAMPMAKGAPWMVALRPTGFNSFHCVVKPLMRRPNFRLVRGAMVSSVIWNGTAGRAEGIEYVDRASGAISRLRSRAVVVAAGTLDSTQILLRSRSADFPSGLGDSHGVLGRYLHDHPRQWWPVDLSKSMTALAHPVYIARDPFDSTRPLRGESMTLGNVSPIGHAKSFVGGRSREFGVQVFATMVPDATNRVSLDPVDPNGRLRIAIRYDDVTDLRMDAARDRVREVFAAADVEATPRGPYHPLVPGSSVHHAGSVRMHGSPEYGVLDRWNRVYDAPNVVVADASCFTTGPEKNPTVTAMAIAARAATHLADELLGLDSSGSIGQG
ncbi:MAG: GMC family oxidoreductase [Ilumatobacteraceae bacterium]